MKRTLIYVILGTTFLLSSFLTRTGHTSKAGMLSFVDYKGSADIYLIDSTGENFQKLASDDAPKFALTWSPTGRFFAYCSNGAGNHDIYVTDVRKKESWQLTDHPRRDLRPAWAPNGKWITFVSDRAGSLDIYRTDADGSNLMRLTNQGNIGTSAWSPDSKWIAYDSYQGGEHFLYIMAADGGQKRKLIQDMNISGCTWSPDGKQIAYAAGITGREGVNIIITDVKGNKRRNLTQVGRNGWARNPTWSPDGKWIAYFFAILPKMMPGERIEATKFWADNVICVINVKGENKGEPLEATRKISSNPMWVPEVFFSVSPSAEKQSVLWGTLKASEINAQ